MPRIAIQCGLLGLLVWSALALISCSGPEAGPSGDPIACTEIGCSSGLIVDATSVRKAHSRARWIEICVKGQCKSFSTQNSLAELRMGGLGEDQIVRVRMVVHGKGGEVLHRSSVRAKVGRTQPNGPECPPTCFQIRAEISDQTGRLVRS